MFFGHANLTYLFEGQIRCSCQSLRSTCGSIGLYERLGMMCFLGISSPALRALISFLMCYFRVLVPRWQQNALACYCRLSSCGPDLPWLLPNEFLGFRAPAVLVGHASKDCNVGFDGLLSPAYPKKLRGPLRPHSCPTPPHAEAYW